MTRAAGDPKSGIAARRADGQAPAVPIELRAAVSADIPLILDFIRRLADYEHLAGEVSATEEELRRTLFPSASAPAAECLLAFEDGEPAGFAVFYATYSTFLARPGLHLEDLFVRTERRGRGIGRMLLQAVARLAHERGCGRLEWTVLDWNQPAIDFYERLGARRLPEWQICRVDGVALERLSG